MTLLGVSSQLQKKSFEIQLAGKTPAAAAIEYGLLEEEREASCYVVCCNGVFFFHCNNVQDLQQALIPVLERHVSCRLLTLKTLSPCNSSMLAAFDQLWCSSPTPICCYAARLSSSPPSYLLLPLRVAALLS
jgi:hypothetical protein